MLRRTSLLTAAVLVTLTGCTAETATEPSTERWHTSAYAAHEILPRTYSTLLDLDDPDQPVDDRGVRAVPWEGFAEPVYHPVAMAMYALRAVESYRQTDDPEYLRAIANGEALLDGSDEIAGARWFPYPFDYALNGDQGMTLTAPWYSGMAQGQALSLVSRLWSVTGDTRWRDAATSIVATYRADGPGDGPWFAHVIAGDLWFEEYPDTRGTVAPTQVVNGHVYSAWGLYDYLTFVDHDDQVLALWDGAVTTVRRQFSAFRLEDAISYYCIAQYCKDTSWRSEPYHRGVANQLDTLGLMTGDAAFLELADTLRRDYAASGATR